MRSRKLLALLFCLITFPAIAGYMTLLGAGVGNISPTVSWVAGTDPFPDTSLTYSGPSLSTMFDSTGKLTYKPNNLLTYSNTFSNAAWTSSGVTLTSGQTDPLGGTNAWRLQGTTSTWLLYQSLSNINTNLVSYWVKSNTGSTQKVRLMLAGLPVGGDLNVTTSWTQISRTGINNGSGSAGIIYDAAGDTVDILIYSAALSAVTYETTPRPGDQVITTASAYYGPRIDYDPNTLAVKGLLIEEARTNLLPGSINFASWWSGANITRTTDGTLASDGATLAEKYTAAAGTVAPQFYSSVAIAISAATNYAVSLEVDGRSDAYPILNFANSTGTNWAVAVFDTSTGADGVATQTDVSGATVVSTKQTYLGNGRYRLSMVCSVAVGTAAYFQPGMVKATTGNTFATWGAVTNSTFAGTEYIYAAFAQLEPGSFATSYIPTAASAVTRAAETVQLTGSALAVMQGASGTAFVQTTDMATNSSTSQTLLGLANGGTMGYPLFYWPSNSKITTVNASVHLSTAVTPTLTSPVRAGIAWSAAGRSIANNGGTVATDANPFSSAAVTGAYLGVGNGGALYWLNGHIASFAIYNARLPDATLQAKSVVGASYAANDNGIRYAFADNDNLPVHWRVAL